MSTEFRNFLALPYGELEELNLQAKADRVNRVSADEVREKHDRAVEQRDNDHFASGEVALDGVGKFADAARDLVFRDEDALDFAPPTNGNGGIGAHRQRGALSSDHRRHS